MMFNNFTNINKTNNHLSPTESLNSDGQQFNQYQQNKQSPLTTNHRTQERQWYNPYPGLRQVKNVAG
jgi:hypothetical protein